MLILVEIFLGGSRSMDIRKKPDLWDRRIQETVRELIFCHFETLHSHHELFQVLNLLDKFIRAFLFPNIPLELLQAVFDIKL
jgi:hypothetical protein